MPRNLKVQYTSLHIKLIRQIIKDEINLKFEIISNMIKFKK